MSDPDNLGSFATQTAGWASAVGMLAWKVWDAVSVRGLVKRMDARQRRMEGDLRWIMGRLKQQDVDMDARRRAPDYR
jgi:hypothetical protein